VAPGLIATVAVAAPIDKPLSYLVPAALRDQVEVGMRLEVPLGRRRVVGYLLALREGEEEGRKPVRAVLDAAPLLDADLIAFLLRAADYYRHPPGEVIRAALPAGLSGRGRELSILSETLYTAVPRDDLPPGVRQRLILGTVRQAGELSLSRLRRSSPPPMRPSSDCWSSAFSPPARSSAAAIPFSINPSKRIPRRFPPPNRRRPWSRSAPPWKAVRSDRFCCTG